MYQIFKKFIPLLIGVGLVACLPQEIDRDISHWPSYKTEINGVEISYRLPPGGKIYFLPPAKIDEDELEISPHTNYISLASIAYDYDQNPSSGIPPAFTFVFGLRSYPTPLDNEISVEKLREVIQSNKELSELNIIKSDIVTIDQIKWIYRDVESYGGKGRAESYSTIFSDTYYFAFGGAYGHDILKNSAWHEDRKNLLREIGATIRFKYKK